MDDDLEPYRCSYSDQVQNLQSDEGGKREEDWVEVNVVEEDDEVNNDNDCASPKVSFKVVILALL